ncbi:TlpA disulfide reductase family protein [Flavobacterium gelidilacus]|uniref:TlpA disulfide reductase family protein n=1 Tax=Flavobacterium gelidilacus TaxID=206041 RepID=UPI000422D4F5|nr:TlpA disulfide reductase family protein [Flavobacterium gelidilacus]
MKFSFSILSLMFFMFFGLTSVAQENEIPKPLKIYKSANYEVKSFDYEGLEAYMNVKNDTTYVYNFWATWCAPCVKELPSFLKLQEAYKDKPFKLVLVSLDFSKSIEKSLLPFLEKKKMNVEVILLNDPDANSWIEKIDKDWSGAIPATLIVNKNQRKFYEQSFEYEALEKEVKSFIN